MSASGTVHEEVSLEQRSLAFTMGSLLAGYPDADFATRLRHTLELGREAGAPAVTWPAWLGRVEEACASDDALDELRSAYLEAFERGREAVSLYETEYGRGRALAKGNELADIAGFYRAFGLVFEQVEGQSDMVDHLAVELEFYSHLLLKEDYLASAGDAEGADIVRDARRKFLEHHVGRLARAAAERAASKPESTYTQVVAWCGELVERECGLEEVEPVPLAFFGSEAEEDEVKCGGTSGRLPVLG